MYLLLWLTTMVISGRVLTEAYKKLPIKLWYGDEPGGSFDVDICTQLLKTSTAIGEPSGLQSTTLKRSGISKTSCCCPILMMRLPRSRSTVISFSNYDVAFVVPSVIKWGGNGHTNTRRDDKYHVCKYNSRMDCEITVNIILVGKLN
jgi:hypothetical protein